MLCGANVKIVKIVSTCFEQAYSSSSGGRLRLKCDGTRAETRFRLSAKRTSPFKSAVASVQSTAGSRGVCISGSNAGYTTFRGSVKSTGYSLHSLVFPSLPLPASPCAITFQLHSITLYTAICICRAFMLTGCWFLLYRYITMCGQQNVTNSYHRFGAVFCLHFQNLALLSD
jgi:hypothetical protein